jgi:hypothetical protein
MYCDGKIEITDLFSNISHGVTVSSQKTLAAIHFVASFERSHPYEKYTCVSHVIHMWNWNNHM